MLGVGAGNARLLWTYGSVAVWTECPPNVRHTLHQAWYHRTTPLLLLPCLFGTAVVDSLQYLLQSSGGLGSPPSLRQRRGERSRRDMYREPRGWRVYDSQGPSSTLYAPAAV